MSALDTLKVTPLAPGAGALQGTPEAQEYQEALAQSMKALEQRLNPETNFFNIAAGFGKSTRGGSFGESLANANEAMGAEQERVEKEAVPIAQMRAQLAGQKFEIAKQSKAMNMVANLMGTDPATAAQAISSGALPAGMMNKFTPEAMLAISQLDPKLGNSIKEASGMENETIKNLLTLRAQGVDVSKELAKYGPGFADVLAGQGIVTGKPSQPAQTTVEGISSNPLLQIFAGGESNMKNVPNAAGASSAFGPYQITEGTFNAVKKDIPELKDATFDDFKKDVGKIQTPVAEALLAKNQDLLKSAKVPASPLNQYSVWFSGDTKLASSDPKTPIDKVMSEDAVKANNLQGKTVGDVMGQLQNNLVRGLSNAAPVSTGTEKPSGASLQTQQQVIEAREKAKIESDKTVSIEREKERDAEFKPQRTTIVGFNPEVTDKIKRNNLELAKLATTNPEVFAFLKQEPGVLAALGTLVQEGVGIGQFGHVGLPVDKVYLATLPPASQNAYIRARQILAENFFANSIANKAAVPGSISNFEEKLLQAPNASLEDTAQSIKDYAKRNLVMNEHRRELNREFKTWENKNPGSSLRSFFMHEDSPYNAVNSKWADMASQLTQGQ
jgi:hypothetical protein